MRKQQLLSLTETAVLVALAVVLEIIKKFIPFIVFQMPSGGSVWISILPIMIIGIRRGLPWGIAGGLAFAIINFLIDGYGFYWGTFLFDYILSFGLLGVTGFFKKYIHNPVFFGTAFFVAGFLRFLMALFSGVLFYSQDAVEAGKGVWIFSFLYNVPILSSVFLCLVLAYALRPVILREIKNY